MASKTLQDSLFLSIDTIAQKLNLSPGDYEPVGRYGAKLSLKILEGTRAARGKLILVTATTPTVHGEGKTVVSIGLAQGLERIGHKTIVTSREPSLGPVFGMKGGAAGGGRSQVEPSRQINLHFHGDFHAITAAHNLLAALIDSHLYFGNPLDLDPTQISWPRAMDMNDRALRHIVVNAGEQDKPGREGANRATGFVITAASEVMAILGLASSRADLRARLEAIVVGVSRSGQPVTAKDLGATGAMMALLQDALRPNLVQTTEGTPAIVHTGPFANIAHGTSSVLSQKMAVRLADYVVNECGFAADLGAEKYFDLVMGKAGIKPAAAVLVVTVQSLRGQGEGSLEAGFANLAHHLKVLRSYGVPVVVAINRFPADAAAELDAIRAECSRLEVDVAVTEAFAKGGAGSVDLAGIVVEAIARNPTPDVRPIYDADDSLAEKIGKIAVGVYGAVGAAFSEVARAKIDRYAEWGFGRLPVCIAKTQYSLSDDPKRMGAPTGWVLQIKDVSLSAGAGFVVAVAGNMMLMPGLPREPRALAIDVDDDGNIVGV
ncbi:MAG TPA: formate--tetrahydrofolate ligase [Terracidiphilus sp.]|nr:formate--tetrahydrofolate ligase [Terracidiphilus sp.]